MHQAARIHEHRNLLCNADKHTQDSNTHAHKVHSTSATYSSSASSSASCHMGVSLGVDTTMAFLGVRPRKKSGFHRVTLLPPRRSGLLVHLRRRHHSTSVNQPECLDTLGSEPVEYIYMYSEVPVCMCVCARGEGGQ
jgi:hypothetical protein